MSKLITDYLRTHSFAQFEEEHGVCARPSACGTKYSLNYDQILTKSGDQLAECCRGMVIRPARKLDAETWKDEVVGEVKVIAWPMNRFYNFGDSNAASVDWNDPHTRVYEKLDGTCCILYFDDLKNEWCVGTRAVCEADLPIRKDDMTISDMTFAGLFWVAVKNTVEDHGFGQIMFTWGGRDTLEEWKTALDKNITYVFELTSPHNRIVVKYDEPRVTLLAARSLLTGEELDIVIEGNSIGVPFPKSWDSLNDPVALAAFVNSADPSKLEGAVVIDKNFNRVKVKSMAWVLSSRAKDLVTVSRRSALEAIILDKIDDVIPIVEKDIADELRWMQNSLATYCRQIDANFTQWFAESDGSRKAFASFVALSGDWSPAYFNLWEKRAPNALAWIKQNAAAGKLTQTTLGVILKKLEQFRTR